MYYIFILVQLILQNQLVNNSFILHFQCVIQHNHTPVSFTLIYHDRYTRDLPVLGLINYFVTHSSVLNHTQVMITN